MLQDDDDDDGGDDEDMVVVISHSCLKDEAQHAVLILTLPSCLIRSDVITINFSFTPLNKNDPAML